MNYTTAIFLISDEIRALAVTYENEPYAKRQTVKTFDADIKEGDYVVVRTDTRHNMTVCKVMDTDLDVDVDTEECVKWVVGTIDTTDYKDLKQQEDEIVARVKASEKRRKRRQLREALLEDGEDIKALPMYTLENGK